MQATKPLTKPTKQRKRLFHAPNHIRHKNFAALLSPKLRISHGTRTIPIRSGDTVRVMRGDNKGFEGKVTRIDRKNYRIYIEGITREKVDGTTIFVPIHPSKVMITNLDLSDKWRKKILERRKKARKKIREAPEEKPSEEVREIREEVLREEEPPKKKLPKKKKKKITEKPAKKEKEEKPKKQKKAKKTTKTRTKRKSTKKTGGKT